LRGRSVVAASAGMGALCGFGLRRGGGTATPLLSLHPLVACYRCGGLAGWSVPLGGVDAKVHLRPDGGGGGHLRQASSGRRRQSGGSLVTAIVAGFMLCVVGSCRPSPGFSELVLLWYVVGVITLFPCCCSHPCGALALLFRGSGLCGR
jgi:hypothetical protein